MERSGCKLENHAAHGIPVVEGLEVDEGTDFAVVIAGQVQCVPGGKVCGPVQEEELSHSLDLAVQLMKVLL